MSFEDLPSAEELRQRLPAADAPGPLTALATNVGASSLTVVYLPQSGNLYVLTDLDGAAEAYIFQHESGNYEQITPDQTTYAVQQNDALVWFPVQPAESIAIMWAYEPMA